MTEQTSWEVGYRMRVTMLSEENRRLVEELAGLRGRFEELQRRSARVWEICDSLFSDTLARRLLRVLDGDPHEFQGRCAGGTAAGDAGGAGVDPVAGAGGGAGPGGGEVPAGGLHGEADIGGSVGVPGPVGEVVAWPDPWSGRPENELAGRLTL